MIIRHRYYFLKVIADRYDPAPLAARVLEGSLPLDLAISGVERMKVQLTLERYGGDRQRAARALGITVERLVEALGN